MSWDQVTVDAKVLITEGKFTGCSVDACGLCGRRLDTDVDEGGFGIHPLRDVIVQFCHACANAAPACKDPVLNPDGHLALEPDGRGICRWCVKFT